LACKWSANEQRFIQLFGILDAFVEVNVRADWELLHKDYMFVLESNGPLVVALALDCAQANARQQQLASVPVGSDGEDVEVEGGRVEEVVKVEVVVLKVLAAPRPKPGGSKSVTYLSLPGDAQLVVCWCQRLSSILFRGVSNLQR
jgi:hypothetical protein